MKQIGFLLGILLLVATVSAECNVTIDIDDEFDGGDEVVFTVEIEPVGGFMLFEIENPLGQTIYSLERQINDDITLAFDTNKTFLGGEYKVIATYEDYFLNGSLVSCDVTEDEKFDINTDFSDTSSKIKIQVDSTYEKKDIETSGIVKKNGVTYDVTLTGKGVPSIIPDFLIEDTDLINDFGGGGTLNMEFKTCESDEESLQVQGDLAEWLNTMKTDCDNAKSLKDTCVERNAYLTVDLNTTKQENHFVKMERDSKAGWDSVIYAIIFGFILCLIFRFFLVHKTKIGESNQENFKSGAI